MGAGCASWHPSLKISLTSSRLYGFMRSRPVRIVVAVLFAIVIVSPAAVVFAVVWTTPSGPPPGPEPQAVVQPERMLPAADVQPGSLPAQPLNVYANIMSGVVPSPLCNLPPRVYVPDSGAGTVDVIDPLTFKVIGRFAVG